MCVDIALVQQLSFHCKSASARDRYRHQYDRDTPWYSDTKKYRQVRDTGNVQNLYRDTTIVSKYRPTLDNNDTDLEVSDTCVRNSLSI